MKNFTLPTADLILCLAQSIDLIHPRVSEHHKQVAYISMNLCNQLGFSSEQEYETIVASALHDIGGLSLGERMDCLDFEIKSPQLHADLGFAFLQSHNSFQKISPLVHYHHIYWNDGNGLISNGHPVPFAAHIIHLADRISILVDYQSNILSQAEKIYNTIAQHSSSMFAPEIVAAFAEIAKREAFWLDLVSPRIDKKLKHRLQSQNHDMNMEELIDLVRLFARVIDFRSHFTSTHSSGVATVAEELARLAGFSEEECLYMKVAGFLHDLGKLAIPPEILDKPSQLSKYEYDIIRCHTYHTDCLLQDITAFDTIRQWGALHHERLDGSGYPYHLKEEELSTGSRIMAVADIFVALTEERPYRKGMYISDALKILQKMSSESQIDPLLVDLVEINQAALNKVRITAQEKAKNEYHDFANYTMHAQTVTYFD